MFIGQRTYSPDQHLSVGDGIISNESSPVLAYIHCCSGISLVGLGFLPSGKRWLLEGNGLDADLASTILVVVIKKSWTGAFATWYHLALSRRPLLLSLLYLESILQAWWNFVNDVDR